RFGLTPWRRRSSPRALFPRRRTLWLASQDWCDVKERLHSLESALRARGAIVRRGGDFDAWDLEVRTGMLGNVRLVMAEEYSGGKQLVRVRVWPCLSRTGVVLALGFAGLALTAALDGAGAAAFFLAAAAVVPG